MTVGWEEGWMSRRGGTGPAVFVSLSWRGAAVVVEVAAWVTGTVGALLCLSHLGTEASLLWWGNGAGGSLDS